MRLNYQFIWLVISTILFCSGVAAEAQITPPGSGGTNSGSDYTPLSSWSFNDHVNWTNDKGLAPTSFTNLAFSNLGNGASLVVGSTYPAWLQFPVVGSGSTNFTPAAGTVYFWFAPSWSGTNQGGTGPGEYGRLFEVGSYTANSSYGLWSIYVDAAGNNLYFSAQTNDLSGSLTTYLSSPIAWTTNYFHNVVVTYSATNTALYLDGSLLTNGPPMTVYPGPDALANGLFIGSDSNGVYQANGLFNDVYTYNVPLDANTIQQYFAAAYEYYMINPLNMAMFNLASANYSPSVSASSTTPNVVTGIGNLQSVGAASTCILGTNANQIWLTNVTAVAAGDGTMTIQFSVEGGQDGYNYDVFAGTMLTSPLGQGFWTWQGQGQRCQTYALSGMPQGTVFLMLGTPQDSDGDGLTDAYEQLVSKTDPHNPYSNLDSILDGWEILLGLNPATSNFVSQRANYVYTGADWLNTVSGVKTGTVTTDNEGNVQTVSQ